jgi:hypothetical protein
MMRHILELQLTDYGSGKWYLYVKSTLDGTVYLATVGNKLQVTTMLSHWLMGWGE